MDSFGFGINIGVNDMFSNAFDSIANKINNLPNMTSSALARVESGFANIKLGGNIGAVGLAMSAPFVLAISKAAEFSDINADIMKTTGQTIQEVSAFSKELEKIDTRTSLSGLLEIGKIGGSIGVATNQMLGFTNAIDMANVALGDEFKGSVEQITKELGTLKNLFDTTKEMEYGLAMSSIGSAINELGAVGLATGPNLTDFAKRMGQLGEIAPSLKATLGLGATLEELGLRSEVAAGGLSNVLLVAGENATAFSKQLGISLKEFREIYSDRPEEIITRLGASLKGLDEVGVAQKLKELKIGSQESIKVFSSLKDNTDLLQKRMTLAGDAFDKNTSLSKEFGIKNNTLAATFEKVSNVLEILSKNLGETLSGAVQPFAEGFISIIKATTTFVQSPIGSVITKIAAGLAVATVAVGGAIAMFGLFNIVTATAIPLLTSFGATLFTALTPMLPFIIGISAVAGAIYFLKQSYDSFSDVMNGGIPATGFLGFMQKVGGVLQGISAIFDTVSKDGFSFSENLQQSLSNVGVLEFVVALGTIAVRIQSFFNGFMGGFDRLSTQFSGMFSAFDRLGSSFGRIFDLLGFNLKNSTSDVSVWGTVGRFAFETLSLGLTGIVFALETVANVLNFVISVGTDFFTNFETGISNLGLRWDTLINGIIDSIKNLPLGETALNFLGITTKEEQTTKTEIQKKGIENILPKNPNILESLGSPESQISKPTQMKDMLNNSAKRESSKQEVERKMLLSMEQSKGPVVSPNIVVQPANVILTLDGQVLATNQKEVNRLENNRD